MRLRTRLSASHLLVALLCLGLLSAVTLVVFRGYLLRTLETQLAAQGRGLAYSLAESGRWSNEEALQEHLVGLGRETGTRITLIDTTGRVVADSEGDPDRMENHASRPEVKAALQGHRGTAIRFSETLAKSMVYVAIPSRETGRPVHVVRLSVPLTAINRSLFGATRVVLMGLAAAAVLSLGLSLLLARSLAEPMRRMSATARRFASGDLVEQVTLPSDDELGELSRSLNYMARQLKAQIDQLSHEKKKSELIVDNMRDGVLLVDRDGRIVAANPAMSKILKTTEEDLIGALSRGVVYSHDLERVLDKALEKGRESEREFEINFPRHRHLRAHAIPLVEGRNQVGALVLIRDISRARRLDQMRQDFIANASHELKTPLAAMKLLTESLGQSIRGKDTKATVRFLETLQSEAERLARLVDDLLTLSRLEAGVRAESEPVSLAELAAEAVDRFRPLARAKGLELRLGVNDAAELPGDRKQLRSALDNLLDNALRHTDSGGISVEVGREDGRLLVRVADTGCGIEAAHIPRIFERFYRVDKARSRSSGGTGLGLSIVKHAASNHGGTVAVESEPGKSTAFTMSFPLSPNKV